MSITSISAASLGQNVLASSNSNQVQQILQTLQNSLTSGDLTDAQSAFQTLQNLNQALASAAGASSNSSQLSTDLTALGTAISSGDLSTAQSAFTAVLGDLKSSASPSQTIEAALSTQSEQLVEGLLSPLNTGSASSSSDDTASLLNGVYGAKSGLNVIA